MSRSYTVSEIDALRRAVESRYLFGTSTPIGNCASISYHERDKVTVVEQHIQTYMLAGVTAEDLIEEDTRKAKRFVV